MPESLGEALRRCLREMGMRQAELARRTGWTPKHVNRLVMDRVELTAHAAILLERATGVDALQWRAIQAAHHDALMRRELAATDS